MNREQGMDEIFLLTKAKIPSIYISHIKTTTEQFSKALKNAPFLMLLENNNKKPYQYSLSEMV